MHFLFFIFYIILLYIFLKCYIYNKAQKLND